MQQVGRMPPAGKLLGSVRRQGIPHLLPLIHDLQRKAVEVFPPSAVSRSWQAWQNPNLRPKSKLTRTLWRLSEVRASISQGKMQPPLCHHRNSCRLRTRLAVGEPAKSAFWSLPAPPPDSE